jgi:2-polyprenyl-3-methyl-5-hydroxy-6-metoxy-1,4-benzoquinol methylase
MVMPPAQSSPVTTEFNAEQANAFADQMLQVLNHGAIALLTSIGHRTELFDTLADLPPATSAQIATAAGLNERYVREWLNGMVTGRVIHHDTATQTYWLPAEHAACLTRAVGSDNMATFAQYIPLLGAVEEQIVHCFYNGGGVPYSEYKRFHAVMAEDSRQNTVAALMDHILPIIPGLIEALHQGIDVLDIGCGQGLALITLAETFPKSRFTGYDFSGEAIAVANATRQHRQLENLHLQVQDAATLTECDRYDLITTFDAIHDQAKPDHVLTAIRRALRPSGTYLMQDIHASTDVSGNLDHPVAPLLYTISCMHCMSVSLAYGGMGLGAMWGQDQAIALLQAAGFSQVDIYQLPHDVQNDYYVIRK